MPSDNGLATLQNLEAQMSRLVSKRATAVRAAENAIRQANRDFDRVAIPLGREISGMRKALEPLVPKVSSRSFTSIKVPEGLDDETQRYYESLVAKKRGKK